MKPSLHSILLFLSVLCPFFSSFGQNLIPNGGFEEFVNHDVKYWQQPADPYYHFEKIEGNSRTGVGYNGLCLWKWQLSEFMAIALLEPLEKGSFYQFTIYARREPTITELNGDSITHLGVLISAKQRNIQKKVVINDTASMLLRLDTVVTWFEMKGIYLAKGGEKYLTLGYFPFINGRSENCTQHQDIETQLARYDSINQAMRDSINTAIKFLKEEYGLDKSWEEINEIQDKRQRKKALDDFRNNTYLVKLSIQLAVEQIQRYYSSISHTYAISNSGVNCGCHVRYYFDDLELVKIEDDKLNAEHATLKNIYFDSDKANLRPESNESLDKLVQELKKRSHILVRVEGYTDNVGEEVYNLQLSDSRAQAVVEYLISKGIDKNMLTFKGFGSGRPIASNANSEGRSKNRRVEISIVQLSQ